MPISKCQNGHFYDDVKYSSCPHCEASPAAGQSAAAAPGRGDDSVTVAMFNNAVQEESRAHNRITANTGDEVTVGLYSRKIDADPVVGWLVGVSGAERGRDHRLHAGRNFIGRSLKMDVSLADDMSVSRENHCSILYDPANVAFYIAPGEGTNTYFNGGLLTKAIEIKDGDTIRAGETDLVFAAFCKGERKWL